MPAPKTISPPPAYFLSLSLENVRSFGDKQTIHFTEGGKEGGKPAQWTVILGDNGVGKTTVLRALAAMVVEKHPNQPEAGIAAMWRLANSTWQFHRHEHKNAVLKTIVGKGLLLTENNADSYVEIIESEVRKIQGAGMLTVAQNPRTLICYGYGAGRTTGNLALGEESNLVDTCVSLFNDRADLLNAEEWFLQADYRIKSDDDRLTKQNFELLKKALIDVLDEVDDLRVSPVAPGGNPAQGLQFKTPYGWVRLRHMSLGYQTLAVWLTDFASKLFIRYPKSKNPLAEPAIVLIDEIDLHLHPSWQRKLLKFLSTIFPNTQFIATAHSPLVVQAAGDAGANVVLLRREGDQTIVVQNLEDVRGWRIDQIMTSELFGLETARSLDTEKKLTRQAHLLNKAKLTAAERRKLDALTQELEGQPMGSAGSEDEEAALLRQLSARLGTSAAAQ